MRLTANLGRSSAGPLDAREAVWCEGLFGGVWGLSILLGTFGGMKAFDGVMGPFLDVNFCKLQGPFLSCYGSFDSAEPFVARSARGGGGGR